MYFWTSYFTQVMSISILSDDNWYPAIIGREAVLAEKLYYRPFTLLALNCVDVSFSNLY